MSPPFASSIAAAITTVRFVSIPTAATGPLSATTELAPAVFPASAVDAATPTAAAGPLSATAELAPAAFPASAVDAGSAFV